jgi:hypothetical protein
VSIQPVVAVDGRVVCRSERPAHNMATDTECQLPEVVLTKFVCPDEHDVLETCRVKNKHIKKNCVSRWSFTMNHYSVYCLEYLRAVSVFLTGS